MPDFNVLITGGGPAGTALAIRLCAAGLGPVAIVEAQNYSSVRPGEALPVPAVEILKALGFTSHQRSAHLHSLGTVACWGSDQPYASAGFNQKGESLHLQRPLFDHQLADLAVESGAELITETKVKTANWQSGGWSVTVKYKNKLRTLTTAFLVDAGGRAASLSHKLGARRMVHAKLLGYYRNLPLEKPLPVASFIEGRPGGWWYAAPLAGKRLATVYMTTPAIGKANRLNKVEPWQRELAGTLHMKQMIGRDETAPVKTFLADSWLMDSGGCGQAEKGWLAIGDAACAWDPLSSQGIYKALNQGQWAAHAIQNYMEGSPEGLKKYRQLVVLEYNAYLKNLYIYYRQETRWPDAPFWKTMQGSINLAPGDRLCACGTVPVPSTGLPIGAAMVRRLQKKAQSPVQVVELMHEMKNHACLGQAEHHILWLQQLVSRGVLGRFADESAD